MSPDAPARVDRAAAQLGVSAHRVRRALEDLADAHLVQWEGPGGCRLPALVREYAAELAAVPAAPGHPLTGSRVDPMAA
ncbi:regulatory GntR family protein [Micromonospora kangleipakensis]|uniref:Regulatory GntR family protein n=1 Tax=Micromonospora kangleipakensis TaxID=1077942 RepID=A0A4Q8BG25_9ACTN|nr:GntR family transcriptional regulator [Micromonospora kangleipakensis]RZU76940.1 regulatory GntR family protein [Micromonospora kangleipakensis]